MSDFPSTLPLFPVSGALLLPHTRLPLVAFEARYIALVEDALGGNRLIGMIQPSQEKIKQEQEQEQEQEEQEQEEKEQEEKDELYDIGCAGRIVRYEELDDGRRFIVLRGVRRFRRAQEQAMAEGGYRRFTVSCEEFALDEVAPVADISLPRERLKQVLQEVSVLPEDFDLAALLACGDEEVVNLLSILCPFAPSEKQALLEQPDALQRSRTLLTLLDMQAAVESSTRH